VILIVTFKEKEGLSDCDASVPFLARMVLFYLQLTTFVMKLTTGDDGVVSSERVL